MRSIRSQRQSKGMNLRALVIELLVPDDVWDTGKSMRKRLVTSASAGTGNNSTWSCKTVCFSWVWLHCVLCSGKDLPLTPVLRNAFCCCFSFPGDLSGFINDCISLQCDSCSFTSSHVNLESGQAEMLDLSPLSLGSLAPSSLPYINGLYCHNLRISFSLQEWAEIQVLYWAKQISSILARQSKMLKHTCFLLAEFSPNLTFGCSVRFPLKFA